MQSNAGKCFTKSKEALSASVEGLHADPADRFIAATAIVHDAMLLTADERLLNWRHRLHRQNAET